MTPAGLKDVAREAGVSVAAVSQAVHGKGRLAPATRARILAVADRLGYVAHPGASALVRGRSHVLALSMPELEHFPELAGVIRHFLGILGGAAGAALEHDHALVAAPGGATSPVWKRVAYDGAVVVEPRAGEPVLAMLRRRGIPVVTIGHEPGAPDANPCADNDVPVVTRDALDHLAGDGDGDVALMLAEPLFSTETQSVAAYERWCAERGAAPRVVVAANPGPTPSPRPPRRRSPPARRARSTRCWTASGSPPSWRRGGLACASATTCASSRSATATSPATTTSAPSTSAPPSWAAPPSSCSSAASAATTAPRAASSCRPT